MSAWYYQVSANLAVLPSFISYYETELDNARKELSLKGSSIERHASDLPGIVESRFAQLQEIEAVLEYINIMLRKEKATAFRKYTEAYARALSVKEAERYSDAEPAVIDMTLLVNEVALLRNKYLGLFKGLEQKSFSLSNIAKLRAAGFEDINL